MVLPDPVPTELAGLTQEKFEELVASNGKGIALDVVRHKLQTTGISSNESKAIASTEWGKNLIQEAVTKNKEAKAALEAAAKAARFKGPVAEFIKKHPFIVASVVPLILFLFYGGGLGMVVGGAAIGLKAASNINTGL